MRPVLITSHFATLPWRKTGDGHGTKLIATDAGLAAKGIDDAPTAPISRDVAFSGRITGVI
jgi:hypothetical protein